MKRIEWLITPAKLIPGCAVFTVLLSPLSAEALSLSRSESTFRFNDFSSISFSNEAFADTTTVSTSDDEIAAADAVAEAIFIDGADQANNTVRTETFATTPPSFSGASGDAFIAGNFNIDAGGIFSFDFLGTIDLFAFVDKPVQEIATATSSIFLNIFDTTNDTPFLLDTLEFSAGISTENDNDFLTFNISDPNYFSIDGSQTFADVNVGDSTETVKSQIAGRYHRTFADATRISLVEVKNSTSTSQSIPEPTTSALVGLLLSSGFMLKRRGNKPNLSSSRNS